MQSRSEETVPAHPDDPAALDTLARRPFARCIANRMDEVWKGRERRPSRRGAADTGSGGAFMLHLHGPWGSGKSSILNFLRDELQDEKRRPEERWVVVEFNAWRHQRIRPPWWALIRDVYAQSARQLPPLRSLWLRVRWWAWRVRADWLPVAAAAALITVAVLVISGVLKPAPAPAEDAAWKGVELALKLLTGALAAWGTVFAVSRSLAFGSARAAQTYTELKSDPLSPIVRLFQRLTASIRQPVAVFIDDLDRCDGKYVVELLEGVQTLFRTAPVTYVVAADRKWICASFQQGYRDFGDDIGEPGRPLGYLFLDKLFQVSASVPRPAPEVQRAYWSALLRAAGTADAATLEARRQQAEAVAEREVGNRKTTEALQAFVQAAADPVEQEGRRAVAAQRITTPEAQRETQKHLLEGFADLLEPNPRSMKRLVNAYGLHQATHFLEHRHVAPDALARWTLIELRWPLLADHLESHPETIAAVDGGAEPAGIPDALKPLLRDEALRDVVRGGAAAPLDEAALRQIVGSGDARTPAQGDVRGDAEPDAGAAADDIPMIAIEGGGKEADGGPKLAVQTQG
ncbi:MAG TPA: P-loop NTPase fold protein [Longimicrobium sp.]|nr:P-loop NTPase fold protein [Longimicrobium sp.]